MVGDTDLESGHARCAARQEPLLNLPGTREVLLDLLLPRLRALQHPLVSQRECERARERLGDALAHALQTLLVARLELQHANRPVTGDQRHDEHRRGALAPNSAAAVPLSLYDVAVQVK